MTNPSTAGSRRQLSRRKRLLFSVVACGLPLAIAALFIPALLRWWRSRPIYVQEEGWQRSGHRYLFDRRLGWRNIPNWRFKTLGKRLETNSRGLRDREYSFAKPAGRRRLLVLGDSYTWGYGVANEECYSELLEEKIARSWQVINTGVSGWGTDQELLYFETEGVKYDPDVVLLAFFIGNDPENNAASVQYGLNKPVFLNTDLKLGNQPVPLPGAGHLIVPNRNREQQLDITLAIIKRLERRCREHDARLVVMKFGGFLYQGNSVYTALETSFRLRFRRQLSEVPYLDLDEAILVRQLPLKSYLIDIEDGHWNAAGHRLTAEILEDFLRQQKIVAADD